MGYKVEAEVWKVVDGKEVELMHDGVIFRRIDHALITEKTIQALQQQEPTQKFPLLKNHGPRVRDPVADSIYDKTKHGINRTILDALRDYILTGYRTEKQIIDWMQQTLGKHTDDYLKDRTKDYIHYLDSNACLDTQLIDGKNAYRLRVK